MKKIHALYMLLALLLVTFPFSNSSAGKSSPQVLLSSKQPATFITIDPKEAKKILDSRSDVLLVDVRNPQELTQGGRIEGAQLVPFPYILRGKHNLPRDKAIMLICAVGGRSFVAGKFLKRDGYKESFNVGGGISAWKKAGLPVSY